MTREELKTVLKLARIGLRVENEKLDEEGRKLENIMKHHINDTLRKWLRDGWRRAEELKDSERILKDFYKQLSNLAWS